MKLTKYLAAAAAVCVAATIAHTAGLWQTLPIIGGAAYCASSIVVAPVQGGPTGQGGGVAGAGVTTGNVICGQTEPAGPPALVGTEVVPVDIFTPGTAQIAGGPATALLPVTALGYGYGNIQVITTNAAVAVANGVSLLISNQAAATLGTLTLPPNPIQGQRFCIANAGSGSLALGTIQVGTTGQSIVQGAVPATVAQETTNPATAVAMSSPQLCYVFQASNTTWYRIL